MWPQNNDQQLPLQLYDSSFASDRVAALRGRHVGQKIVWERFEVSVRSDFKVVGSLGRVGMKFAGCSNLVSDQRKMLIRVFVGTILAQKMGLYPWKVESYALISESWMLVVGGWTIP